MNQNNTFKKLPGVLAFKRGHIISDALMFNLHNGNETPVQVVRHGIRGTQNFNKEDQSEVSNIQITETAKLHANTKTMLVRFSLAFLPIEDALNACVGKERQESLDIRNSISNFLKRAKNSDGLKEVARRYARNIANGRWLWRNRSIATRINTTVSKIDLGNDAPGQNLVDFNALAISTKNFENYEENEIKLGEEIAKQMRGDSDSTLIVETHAILRGTGLEVFPSQNYIETKSKPKGFARPLYKIGHPEPAEQNDIRIMGQAAIRDQKVYNAIRTIDTWYSAFEEEGIPIAVEPKGANLEMQQFYRQKDSSFDLFKRLNQINPDEADGMFCIACFDRGGVYSDSDKVKTKDTGEE